MECISMIYLEYKIHLNPVMAQGPLLCFFHIGNPSHKSAPTFTKWLFLSSGNTVYSIEQCAWPYKWS